jgi:hypothetical protein
VRAALGLVAAISLGCSYTYVATDGKLIPSDGSGDAEPRSVRVSAARDLHCQVEALAMTQVPDRRDPDNLTYVADGCGQRATYRILCERRAASELVCRPLLMSRFPFEPAQ